MQPQSDTSIENSTISTQPITPAELLKLAEGLVDGWTATINGILVTHSEEGKAEMDIDFRESEEPHQHVLERVVKRFESVMDVVHLEDHPCRVYRFQWGGRGDG